MPKPPRDQPAILAASAAHPCSACGPWILGATILGSSMAFIDGTVVNVALPALQSALGATVSQVPWVVECYALFLAALLLVDGSLGDLYGRRKIFAIGVILFAGSCSWCGLAANAPSPSQPADYNGWADVADNLLAGRKALTRADAFSRSIPLARFHRRKPAYSLSLGGLERSILFLSLEFDPGPGIHRYRAGAALLPFILLMFVLSRCSGGLVDRYGAKRDPGTSDLWAIPQLTDLRLQVAYVRRNAHHLRWT